MSVKKKRVCPRQRGSLENDNLCVCVCEYKKERESGKEKKCHSSRTNHKPFDEEIILYVRYSF